MNLNITGKNGVHGLNLIDTIFVKDGAFERTRVPGRPAYARF